MTISQSFLRRSSWIPLLLIAVACILVPSSLLAQDSAPGPDPYPNSYSGPNVDICNYWEADWGNSVEEMVCLTGDINGLNGYAVVDQALEWYVGYPDWPDEGGDPYVVGLGAEGAIYGSDGSYSDTGMAYGGLSPYSPPTIGSNDVYMPVTPNVWYSMDGLFSECYDSSGTGSTNCSWNGGNDSGIWLYVQIPGTASPPTPSVSVACSPNPLTSSSRTLTCTATVSNGATGNVSFTYNGVAEGTVALSSGSASADWVVTLPPSIYSVVASYSGDGNNGPASGSTRSIVLGAGSYSSPSNLILGVDSSTNPAVPTQQILFTARLFGYSLTQAPSGSITFYDGTQAISDPIAINPDGTAQVTWTAPQSVANHPIAASYSGDNVNPAVFGAPTLQLVQTSQSTPSGIASAVITGTERTGGSTPDTGIVTVTVGATQEQVSYASSDTANTVANNIATAFSMDCNSHYLGLEWNDNSGASYVDFIPKLGGAGDGASVNVSSQSTNSSYTGTSFNVTTRPMPPSVYANLASAFPQRGLTCAQQTASTGLDANQRSSYQQSFNTLVAPATEQAAHNQASIVAASRGAEGLNSGNPFVFHPLTNNTSTYSLKGMSFVDGLGSNRQLYSPMSSRQSATPPVQAGFSVYPSAGFLPTTVSITPPTWMPPAGTTDPLAAYYDFGDGSVLAEPSFFYPSPAVHTYQTAGSYTIKYCQSYIGVSQTPANCPAIAAIVGTFHALAGNGSSDSDGDGLTDAFELAVANDLMPYYHVSDGEKSGTGFATFLDQSTETVSQVFAPTPPIVNYAVKPYGFLLDQIGNEYAAVRVDYLTLWNRDDGLQVSASCKDGLTFELGLLGLGASDILQGIQGHPLDNERSAVLILAPTTNHQLVQDPSSYKIASYYLAAHEGTIFDQSTYYDETRPFSQWTTVTSGVTHAEVFLSRAKHSTYGYNPAGDSIVPSWEQGAVYSILAGFYTDCLLMAQDDQDVEFCSLEYGNLGVDAATIFDLCVVEQFTEKGAFAPSVTINVGEPSDPLNGAHYILDPSLEPKLTGRLFF